jgi:hypothetical protein
MANISNGVLYGVFAFSAVGAAPLLNLIGPRWTLLFGITGYPIYQGRSPMSTIHPKINN